MGLAIPVGQLADRVGRVPVLLAGYALLFIVYGALLMSSLGYAMLILCLLAPRRLLRRHRRGADRARRRAAAGGAAGERDRDTDHRGQHRQPALLARLRRPLVRRSACSRAVLVFAAALALAILARGAAAAARRSEPPCMGSRNGKILVALVVLCVVGGRRLRRGRRPGPERQTTTDARPQAAGRAGSQPT